VHFIGFEESGVGLLGQHQQGRGDMEI
jgi:hypothetical protein